MHSLPAGSTQSWFILKVTVALSPVLTFWAAGVIGWVRPRTLWRRAEVAPQPGGSCATNLRRLGDRHAARSKLALSPTPDPNAERGAVRQRFSKQVREKNGARQYDGDSAHGTNCRVELR